MNALTIIISILIFLACIGLNVVILLQKDRASGFTGSFAGSGGDTYWSKNKGRSVEGSLERYTKIGAFAFVLLVVLFNILM